MGLVIQEIRGRDDGGDEMVMGEEVNGLFDAREDWTKCMPVAECLSGHASEPL